MKKIILLTMSLCLLVSCSKKKNDLHFRELSGNVLSVISTSYEAKLKFGEVQKDKIEDDMYGDYNSITEFNEFGNIVSVSSFENNGDLLKKSIYSYNENNLLNEISVYNASGDLESKTIHQWTDDFCHLIITYDKDNKESYKNIAEKTGDNTVKRSIYNYGKAHQTALTHTEGNLSISRTLDMEGKEQMLIEEKDNHITKLVYDSIVVTVERNKYNHAIKSENAEILQSGFVGGIGYMNNGKTFYYEYEYDNHNNWIKRIDYEGTNRTPIRIIERNIEYK